MSINAINSVSLYEYYYQINHSPIKKSKKVEKPSDEEAKNTANVKEEKINEQQTVEPKKEVPFDERPWADIMEQLGLSFNKDPKDDIIQIEYALDKLTKDIDDKELLGDIKDLDDYIKSMYITYYNNDFDSRKISSSLSKELEGISAINKAFAF